MHPLVTLVIPALNDADGVGRLLAQIPAASAVEVVVVDGGHDAALEPHVAAHPRASLERTHAGRAHQMNVGAGGARSEWLLFLHADSQLPAGWLDALAAVGRDVVGGWFRFALDDRAWQARLIERGVAWRVRLFRLPYGDQGFFVRSTVFESMGGFRPMPLLEDVDFIRRLAAAGRVMQLPLTLRTSSRRYRRDGWFTRSMMNVVIVLLYFVGVSPVRLAGWYRSASE